MKSKGNSLSLLYQDHKQSHFTEQQRVVKETVDVSKSASQPTCSSCRSTAVIFDDLTGEVVCTQCGIVISERQMTLEKPFKSNDKTGMPFSLAYPDKGLSTVITNSNTDAAGTLLNHDQITNVNKIRYYNKLSDSKNHTRNLKNAFVVMATIKDKLTLTDPIIERGSILLSQNSREQVDQRKIYQRNGSCFSICCM